MQWSEGTQRENEMLGEEALGEETLVEETSGEETLEEEILGEEWPGEVRREEVKGGEARGGKVRRGNRNRVNQERDGASEIARWKLEETQKIKGVQNQKKTRSDKRWLVPRDLLAVGSSCSKKTRYI